MPVKVTDQFQAPAGVYSVQFGEFSTRDESKEPVAKSTDYGLRVFAKMPIVEGEFQGENVPLGTDLEDGLAGWCLLFSGLPPQSTELAEIEKQMQTEKVIRVRVNEKGFISGPFVPKTTYLAKFAGFSKRHEDSGQPILGKKEWKGKEIPTVYWNFEVVAGDYLGTRVPGSSRYSIRQRGNEMEIAAKSVMFGWCSACGVDWGALPDISDPENALPELEQVMFQSNVLLSVQVGDSGWVESDQSAVAPAPQGITVAQEKPVQPKAKPAPKPKPAPPKQEQPKSRVEELQAKVKSQTCTVVDLLNVVEGLCETLGMGKGAVENSQLTEIGKKFATEFLVPLCAQNDIPRSFAKMNEAQISFLIEQLLFKEEETSGGDEF